MADKVNLTAKGFAEFRAVNEDMDMKQTTRVMAALSSYEAEKQSHAQSDEPRGPHSETTSQ
jgi:hypothetical protein